MLTDSEFSRREIDSHLGIPSSRVDVIYPGVTSRAHLRDHLRDAFREAEALRELRIDKQIVTAR